MRRPKQPGIPAVELHIFVIIANPPAEDLGLAQASRRRKQSSAPGSAATRAARMVSQEEDTMFDASPCSVYLLDQIAHIHAILKSDGWKAVLAVFGATRAIVYFCNKSPHYEARELAAAATMASILAVLIVVSEPRAPTLARHALACKVPAAQSRLAATEVPPAGPRVAYNGGH